MCSPLVAPAASRGEYKVRPYEPRRAVQPYCVSDGSRVLQVWGTDPPFSLDGTLLAIATAAGIALWAMAP